jgi:subtilisin family serine protease
LKRSFLLVFLALSCFCGYAQTIDPVLLHEMGQINDDEKIKVFVIMKSHYDRAQLQSLANGFATCAERREFVVNELKQFAEDSQHDLRLTLEEMEQQGMTTAPKIIWMANAMYFSATKQAINDLAMRSDIEIIGLDEKKQMPVDEESIPVPASNTRGVAPSVAQVNAHRVWPLGYTGKGVVVAVLDSGVNYNHPDLADHLWEGGDEFPNHGWDFVNNDNDPMDEAGHGTSCAGIICGDGTEGLHTGIAPDATLMCIRVQEKVHATIATLTCEGMQWAVEHGADVLSMSLGIFNASIAERELFRHTCASVLDASVVAAVAVGNTGNTHKPTLFVPNNVGVPASCPPPYMDPVQAGNPGELSCVVAVGAVDAYDQATDFTSHGPVTWKNTKFADYPYTPGSTTEFGLIRPDVCAPGFEVYSTNYRTMQYSQSSGTSCAAPSVAGCMALILSKNRETTPADLCRILEETAVSPKEGKSDTIGYGRVDALAAVNAVTGHSGNIVFADPTVKEICVSHWDTNHDGELSYLEATRVDSLKNYFQETGITSFDELQYFTEVKRIRPREFAGCVNLTSISIPNSVISIGKNAFDGCNNLAVVTMYAPRTVNTRIPNLYEGVFDHANSSLAIYVPYESLDEYKSVNNNIRSVNNWSAYADMIYPWLQKSVFGYGTSTESDRWVFIASPLAANAAPSTIEGMIAETETEYDLYRFNQGVAAEWENYKQGGDHHHFELENGRGYLYASKEDADIIFKGAFNEGASQEVSLACSGDGKLKGWNLVGNPFPYEAIVVDRSFYIMNKAGTGLAPSPVSSGRAIPACTGIIVMAESTEENPTVTFSRPNQKGESRNRGMLQIALTHVGTGGYAMEEDIAVVSFNEGDQLGKFYFGENNANIYFPQGNEEYSIVVSEAFGTIPLNFVAKENNRYVLTVIPERVELNYLHLIDNLTGEDVDLLAPSTVIDDETPQSYMPSYTFTAQTTDYASRFRLVLSSRGDENDDNAPFAFISDGQIILIDGDTGDATLQIVDVTGRILVCRDASNSSPVSITGMASGVYVLRLVNGDDVKTQMIIVP